MKLSRFTVRTSDRRVFRRCLRKWGWQSSMKSNLQKCGTEQNINFWFGSAIHFAMEDYFGYNRFGDPRRAFKAYYDTFKEEEMPAGAMEHYDLGMGMLTYFLEWYPRHNKDLDLKTVWLDDNMQEVKPEDINGHPAVQGFFLDLGIQVVVDAKTEQIICKYDPEDPPAIIRQQPLYTLSGPQESSEMYMYIDGQMKEVLIVPIHYHGTLDRVVVDRYGRWWILDYKTAKGADTNKLETDDQISAYLWAAEQWFKHPIYGFIYLQLTKDIARPPKRLKDGSLSVDKKQKTTYHLVREAIIDEYGSIQKAPNKYIEFMNTMAEKETPEGDRFIRWDFVKRSPEFIISTYHHIMGEVQQMINPDLYLYPNPTRDCIWDCPLRDACLISDNGRKDEVKTYLNTFYEHRPRGEEGEEPEWRSKIVYPDTPAALGKEEEFISDWDRLFNIELPEEYVEEGD